MTTFCPIPTAIRELKKGNMLILFDADREKEGDFYIPSSTLTPDHMLTMIRYGGGLVCCAITAQQAARLSLPLMVPREKNTEVTRVNFTVSANAKKGITTGASAFDRTKTIQVLSNPTSSSSDITKPGHVFGLVAQPGGVLARAGQTEAAVDLARLAGFTPSGVLCEIVSTSGHKANESELRILAKQLSISLVSLTDLIAYMKKHPLKELSNEGTLIKTQEAYLPTSYATFNMTVFTSLLDNTEHVFLQLGDLKQPVLTRIHSQCLTGDTLLSLRCDCREQLHTSMELIAKEGNGVIVYLSQEGRGIGLSHKIKAYTLQDRGLDTVEANLSLGFAADSRDFKIAADILHDSGITSIELLTNNPMKEQQLEQYGIHVEKTIPLEIAPTSFTKTYLITKKHKLGHRLTHV